MSDRTAVVSSAYWRSLISSPSILIPIISEFWQIAKARASTAPTNKYGESGSPYLPPLSREKKSVARPLLITQLSILWYSVLTSQINSGPKPKAFKQLKWKVHSKLSNALWKSISIIKPEIFSFRENPLNQRSIDQFHL